MATVLLVDDQEDMRVIARTTLALDGRFNVVAEGRDGHGAVRLAGACRPDVVLLDLEMPWLDGAEAVPLIRRASPGSCIVVWTVAPASDRAREALELGASTILDKGNVYDGTLPDRLTEILGRRAISRASIAAPTPQTGVGERQVGANATVWDVSIP